MAKLASAVNLDERLHALMGSDGVRLVSNWIAASSLWTNPDVYRGIQVIYPQTRRLSGKEVFRSQISGLTVWRNEPAKDAFWTAYGVSMGGTSPREYDRAHLCHIYEQSAHHPEHYTNLGNLVVVPDALDSFTEWSPVRNLLKWRSFELYSYRGPAGVSPSRPSYVPTTWPGVKELDSEQVAATVERLARMRREHPSYTPRRSRSATPADPDPTIPRPG